VETWERQDNETDAAWSAFQVYRDLLPADRSYDAAYREKYNKPPTAHAPLYLRRWAHAHNWRERAAEYDRHQDEVIREALVTRRLQARQETADLGELLRKKAANAARMLVAVTQQAGEMNGREVWILEVKLTPSDIARLASTGVELERLALGESTENLDLSAGGQPIRVREVIVELPADGGSDVAED
jgi:hypothetical protein